MIDKLFIVYVAVCVCMLMSALWKMKQVTPHAGTLHQYFAVIQDIWRMKNVFEWRGNSIEFDGSFYNPHKTQSQHSVLYFSDLY